MQRVKRKEKPMNRVKLGLDRLGERECESAEPFSIEIEVCLIEAFLEIRGEFVLTESRL